MDSLGKRIQQLRKRLGLTQEELADKVGVTAQSVSKWETDMSCPDITMLPRLADIFGVTIDELMRGRQESDEVRLQEPEQRKGFNDMVLRVRVNSVAGDRMRINLPMPLVKLALESGMAMPQINGNETLKSIDFAQIIAMVESGLIGKLLEVESADGDTVEIVVE